MPALVLRWRLWSRGEREHEGRAGQGRRVGLRREWGGSKARGRKYEQKKVRKTESDRGESQLVRGGLQPWRNSVFAELTECQCARGLGVAPDENKKGRRKGNVSSLLWQKRELRFSLLKTRPQRCFPNVVRWKQQPGFHMPLARPGQQWLFMEHCDVWIYLIFPCK